MDIKFIKTDPSNQFDVTKLKYINELENDRAYYLSFIGGELEWEVGRIVTFDELSKGRENQSYYVSGEIYIQIVRLIFRLMDIPMFDLGRLLQIHELLNEEDLKLLIIHTNNAINRSMNKEERAENKEKGKDLKEQFNDFLLLIENESNNTSNEPQQETKTDAPPPPPPKENQYQNIFISNGFDVWQEMYNKFQITESSRTDIKFMFEIMKREKMIHKSVSQKAYLEWINDVFEIDVQKTSNIDLKNTKNLGIYNTAKTMFIK